MDLQVTVRLFNGASTQIGSKVLHREMSKASTPPIKKQAQTACPLNVNAQDVKESKLWELISCAYKALQAIYAGWWLNEEWGHKYFVVGMQTRYIFGGQETGLESALMSSCCQPTKTIRPAVEKLHCCITAVDSIQFSELPANLTKLIFISSLKAYIWGWTLICGGQKQVQLATA